MVANKLKPFLSERSNVAMADATEKTTPIDVSEFEREKLRFFLGNSDMASLLSEVNPSLAWLPILAEMNLLQNDAALPLWVERNFNSVEAVREVVANIRFFKTESARILGYRLNDQRDKIEPLLAKCWQLIIRHIRNAQPGLVQNAWFEVLPQVKRGDLATDVLERVSNALTPKLFVERRYGWYDEPGHKIEKPTDIFSIKYRVEEGLSDGDFLSVWPKTASATTEEQLVRTLTNSLGRVLADAIEVGVESNFTLSISDVDVPSVAAHEQNQYRKGFLPIVRVIAELWSRLIQKNARIARDMLREWERSDLRLVHRLALFAAANPKVAPQQAADTLIQLPQGELFLTNSQVEVHRLIRNRWAEFPPKRRGMIEKRIIEGPPADWFKEDADLSRPMDRYRFHLLLDLERSKVPLGKEASELLRQIRERHPQWRDTEPEKVGFAMWQGSVTSVVGSKEKLSSVPSKQLIRAAKKAADEADYMEGDSWQGLCQEEPMTAFLGIENAPASERWHEWAWRPLLWAAANKITDPGELNRIASLLAKWPKAAPFEETASGAGFWMDQVADKLKASHLWAVWDLIEQRSPRRTEELDKDVFSTALNDPSGNLASVLLKRTPRPKGQVELGKQLRIRYEKLIGGGDVFALFARVRFSAAVAFLFERAPKWTTANLVPSFNWDSSDALAMWSARKYSNQIGSAELFRLVKEPFSELFSRPDVPEEDLRVFSDWLAAILLANRAVKARYPLTTTEVRSILRRSGHSSLSSFAHRLATQMESATPAEKERVWNETVGPVFQGAWPLDVELQTATATFKLVQILRATGAAFGNAAKIIVPFIRAENPRHHSSVFSISEADAELYGIAPTEMLGLLSAVAGDAPDHTVYGLKKALTKLQEKAPQLTQTKAFQKLAAQASPY
jgi:hypothetical protein